MSSWGGLENAIFRKGRIPFDVLVLTFFFWPLKWGGTAGMLAPPAWPPSRGVKMPFSANGHFMLPSVCYHSKFNPARGGVLRVCWRPPAGRGAKMPFSANGHFMLPFVCYRGVLREAWIDPLRPLCTPGGLDRNLKAWIDPYRLAWIDPWRPGSTPGGLDRPLPGSMDRHVEAWVYPSTQTMFRSLLTSQREARIEPWRPESIPGVPLGAPKRRAQVPKQRFEAV